MVLVGDDEDSALPYNDTMQKAYVMVYDIYGNIIAQLDVLGDGYFYSALFPGDYTIEVKFEGQQSGYKEKVHIVADADPIEKMIYLKPVK